MEDGADGRSLATVMGTKQKVQLPGISSLAFLSPLVHFSAYFSGFFVFSSLGNGILVGLGWWKRAGELLLLVVLR